MLKLNILENKLNFKFNNKDLLTQALVHRSYVNENHNLPFGHNERLEFLGDAVLEIVITEYLYQEFPDNPEGDLTNWRASLVNSKMLYQVALSLGIEDYILLSKGESNDTNSKARQYILADAVEAIIGAMYLDQGIDKTKDFINHNIIVNLADIIENKKYLDPKSKFQELAQEKEGITPVYKVLEESGPDHDKTFKVGLFLKEDLVSSGFGSSKQEAQINAAENGLKIKNW